MTRTPPLPEADRAAAASEPAIGLPAERADAILPRDLLDGDEAILLLIKPSPWFMLLGSTGVLVVLWAAVGVTLWLGNTWGIGRMEPSELMTLAAVLSVARIVWQAMEWMARTYVLTDRRAIRIKGVLRVNVSQIALTQLDDPVVLYGLAERLAGLGTVGLIPHGSSYPTAYWSMLRQPQGVQRRIREAIARYGGRP